MGQCGGEVADGGRGEEQPQPQDNNPPWFMADETRLVFGNRDQYDEVTTRSSQFFYGGQVTLE